MLNDRVIVLEIPSTADNRKFFLDYNSRKDNCSVSELVSLKKLWRALQVYDKDKNKIYIRIKIPYQNLVLLGKREYLKYCVNEYEEDDI